MIKVKAYATHGSKELLIPFSFERRNCRLTDVQIEILYCGVCHSDLHHVKNEWKNTIYPLVPGHEIVGRVVHVGDKVKQFNIGDIVGVGCLIDSCRSCPSCRDHLEQYCEKGLITTYNSLDKYDHEVTYGGYSSQIIVDEKFVLHIPKTFKESDLVQVAPLLCAGITTYSPLKHWKVAPGSLVGIIGLGGLGHMAVKIAHAMGAFVVVFTSSQEKIADAIHFGANAAFLANDPEGLTTYYNKLDFILETSSAPYTLATYLELLKRDGVMCLVGLPSAPSEMFEAFSLIKKRASIVGSLIGGLQETQEMLDFCAKHQILSTVEVIPIQQINEAYKKMEKRAVKYRFVIDMATLH